MALAPKPKKVDASAELIALIRQMSEQQNEVLKVAMEAQKAQAEVLSKWMAMFTPSATPTPSTTEEERMRLREEMDKAQWDPVSFDPFSGDLQ